MTALAAKLEGVVQFTYLHGPHAVEATPFKGVVPLPPETPRGWWTIEQAAGIEGRHYAGVEAALEALINADAEHRSTTGRGFDGVLGFSQGAALVHLVCAMRQREREDEDAAAVSEAHASNVHESVTQRLLPDLSHALLVAGYPFGAAPNANGVIESIGDSPSAYYESRMAPTVFLPSLHVSGSKDARVPALLNLKLAQSFDESLRETVSHGGGHSMPSTGSLSPIVEWYRQRHLVALTTNDASLPDALPSSVLHSPLPSALMPPPDVPPAWVYSFNAGVEAEAAGRAPTKSFAALRRDLATLPWLLAGPDDIVLSQRPVSAAFVSALAAAGVDTSRLPAFSTSVPHDRQIAGHRPFGIAGSHLGRSNVARYRSDVRVCRTLEEVVAAAASFCCGESCSSSTSSNVGADGSGDGGGEGQGRQHTCPQQLRRAVLKAEFSTSGQGVRVVSLGADRAVAAPSSSLDSGGPAVGAHSCGQGEGEGDSSLVGALCAADAQWATNCLRRDGVLTVEPWLDEIICEVSGEWLDGTWCGVTQFDAPHMRWGGTHLHAWERGKVTDELHQFVCVDKAVEALIEPLDVPGTCGSSTCGLDCAIVRRSRSGGRSGTAGQQPLKAQELEVKILEVNARTTMSHYAHAARRRVPGAKRFVVVRVSELGPNLLALTDHHGLPPTGFVAAVDLGRQLDPPPALLHEA